VSMFSLPPARLALHHKNMFKAPGSGRDGKAPCQRLPPLKAVVQTLTCSQLLCAAAAAYSTMLPWPGRVQHAVLRSQGRTQAPTGA
jgi:hypothetical protein